MEKAIKLAIEGGYKYNCGKGLFTKGDGTKCTFSGVNTDWTVWTRLDNDSSICVSHEDTLLDPLFWQALLPDKDIKCWACNGEKYFEDFFTKEIDKEKPCGNCKMKGTQVKTIWLKSWHDFIDHIADGKSVDSFFNEILK